jgi:hypothetical protein
MHCPYCGGLNADEAAFCSRCGRDLKVKAPARSSIPQQAGLPPAPPVRPQNSVQPGRPQVQPVQFPGAPAAYPQRSGVSGVPLHVPLPLADAFGSATTKIITGPDAPAPFPPHTIAHLRALEVGALEFTEVSEETIVTGGKKIIRILYPRCIHWQQVATLLKASRKYQSEKYSSLIIQGFYNQDMNVYAFNNGQLIYDRGVRLGSQILNRYRIDTGTGFEGEAARIVMADE